ncbi:D-alanyl-D-alanine carboxypeptidase family protein [Dongia soli]|uniref:D-alanyl-D-alanine carboxypeptidase family protein n=1 Tax=Dongia soli TaxID=600628 RepID=A0ABU5EA61_9PROT|nr:D-alanyl-D-alanine carboxypeptidase family protein [Dongia soli]MDY0883124.1 D-alanyl-D-alanine carboxypeptidase family protein [Dongia soli]
MAALILGILTPLPGYAASSVSLVVDADSGQVLEADSPNALWYPASLTKMMTVYIAFSEIKAGQHRLEEPVTISATAAGQSPVKFGFRKGQKITLSQAISATIVASANDAAAAIAEQIAGTEAAFAQRMTEMARDLGMSRTVFRNATGLPDNEQVTTAADMARLALALIHDFPDQYHFFGDKSVSIAGRTLPTVNGILVSYRGADGLKTGFTCGSGYNLVASARQGNRRLVGVLLGGGNRGERASQMVALLNKGFARSTSDLPMLQDISLKLDASDAPPPIRLKGGDCDQAVIAGGTSTTTVPRVSGWGIVFGSFNDQKRAQAAVSAARKRLPTALATKGKPAIIRRDYEGTSRYSALLVGLAQADAGRACKAMWENNAYCLALSPQVLKNPQAVWR